MSIIVKLIKTTVIILLLVSLSCNRSDLFDFAKNGIPKIYAISHDGTATAKLIVAAKSGYNEIFEFPAIASPTEIAVTARGRVVVKSGGTYYSHDSDSYRKTWSALPAVGGVHNGMAGDEENVYLEIGAMPNYLVHQYQKDTMEWSTGTAYTSTGNIAAGIFYSPRNDYVYIYKWATGGTLYIHKISSDLNTPETITHTYLTTVMSWGYAWDDTFYTGNNVTGEFGIFTLSPSEIEVLRREPPANTVFVVIDNDNIFNLRTNVTDIEIYKLSSGNAWVHDKTIVTMGTPVLTAKRYDDEHIAVGISSGVDYDGLWLYNIKKKTATRLSPLQVFALDVK